MESRNKSRGHIICLALFNRSFFKISVVFQMNCFLSFSSMPNNLGDENSTLSSNDSSYGSFAGPIIGVLAVLAILAAIIAFLLFKRNRTSDESRVTSLEFSSVASMTPASSERRKKDLVPICSTSFLDFFEKS